VAAYRTDAALTAGFDFYRAFDQDATDNVAFAAGDPVTTPLLYVRGEHERGAMDRYERGLRDAGVGNLTTARVPGAGHFAQEENPDRVWEIIRDFAAL
jgi:pimeloyl-ACP methyl ester carboxylesterase